MFTKSKLADAWKDESTSGDSSKRTVVTRIQMMNQTLPLPPPSLNLDKLMNCMGKWADWDEVIQMQNKHIQNLQDICQVYYSHIQKIHSTLNKELWQKIACTNNNSKEVGMDSVSGFHRNLGFKETSSFHVETDPIALTHKSKSESISKVDDKFLAKFEKDVQKEAKPEGNRLKAGIPNNSDFTDFSSSKSGQVLTWRVFENNSKKIKVKAEAVTLAKNQVHPLEKRKSPSFQEFPTKSLKIVTEPESRNIDNHIGNAIATDRFAETKNKIQYSLTGKEVNIESIDRNALNQSNNLFMNEISWINNEGPALKNQDTSEYYDQWLNESNIGGAADWTSKVPKIEDKQLDSSEDSSND